ncbi:MAG TPA: DinB family protein [Candidatus Limnocylindrales bacterium]
MTDRSFEHLNDESRERLARLVKSLTPSQLEIELGEGWTVASALAHTGFWDRWQADRWEEMLSGNWKASDEDIIAAEHLANEALDPYWAGVDAADVPGLALAAATALDALIASAPDSLVDTILAGPAAYLVKRSGHRGEHLDHIERTIAAVVATVDHSYNDRNAETRHRLASLVERLRPEDMLLRSDPSDAESWTIAQALAHIAFWDASLAKRWRSAITAAGAEGPIEPIGIPYAVADTINDPLTAFVGAWTERLGLTIGIQALAAAEDVDALIVQVGDRIPASLPAGRPSSVNRWMHREEHIEQIKAALASARPDAAPVDRSYLQRNSSSRTRLRDVLGGLAGSDLARSDGEGEWTVGQIIGHMAFWDRFLASRWRAALAGGPSGQPSSLPHELADLLNDGLPATWSAFAEASAEAVIAEALAAAKEIDGLIAGLPESTPIDAILGERPALLDRSIHRRSHLDQIELAVRRQ